MVAQDDPTLRACASGLRWLAAEHRDLVRLCDEGDEDACRETGLVAVMIAVLISLVSLHFAARPAAANGSHHISVVEQDALAALDVAPHDDVDVLDALAILLHGRERSP